MEQKQLHYLLPPSKHYPGRLNLYNKTKVFKLIKSNLSNANWARLCDGCFGPVVKLGDKLKVHSQLIHFVLMHELKTQYKHEMWFRIGGNVCRFALSDFAAITGLNCSYYKPIVFPPVNMVSAVSGNRCTYSDLVQEFVRIKDEETKFKIANLLIIEGVLLPQRSNAVINPNHLAFLSNNEEFDDYPWGRICYDELIQSLKKLNQSERDHSKFDDPEYRFGYNLFGYPIAFMIWILESFPAFRAACDFTCRDPKEAPYILRWSSISTKYVRHSELDEFKGKELECVYPSCSDFQAFDDYEYRDEVCDPVFDDLMERIIGKRRTIGKAAGKRVEEAESESSTEDNLSDFVLASRSLAFKKSDLPVDVNVNKQKKKLAKAGGNAKSFGDLVNVNQGNVKPFNSVDAYKWKVKQRIETAKRGKRLQLPHASKVEPKHKKSRVSQNVNSVPLRFEKFRRPVSDDALAIVVHNGGLPLDDMENENTENLNDGVNNVDVEVAKILFSVKDSDESVDVNINDKEKAEDMEKGQKLDTEEGQKFKETEEPQWVKELKESMSSMHMVMKDVQFRLDQIEMQVVDVHKEVGCIKKRMDARHSVFDVGMPSSDTKDDEQLDKSMTQVNGDDSVKEAREQNQEENKDAFCDEVKVDEYVDFAKEETKGKSADEAKDNSVEDTKDDSNGYTVEETKDDSIQETAGGIAELVDVQLHDILQDIKCNYSLYSE